MESKLTVSIITIVFNNYNTLEQTIRNVLSQSYKNIEYIIIDGGSTDGSVEIIRKYEKAIKWISEPDNGISDAFNKGISMCSGDLIGIINADDWYETDAVEQIVHSLENSCSVFCGDINLIDKAGNVVKTKKSRVSWLPLGMYVMHPSVFVRKDVYMVVGGFNTQLKIAMDYDMLLRIRKHKYRIKYINKAIANMRLEGASSNISKMHNEELQVMKNNLSGFSYLAAILSNFSNRSLYHFLRVIK